MENLGSKIKVYWRLGTMEAVEQANAEWADLTKSLPYSKKRAPGDVLPTQSLLVRETLDPTGNAFRKRQCYLAMWLLCNSLAVFPQRHFLLLLQEYR
jgi:hypothetical protein